jgi:two-component system, cell cycle sensor histidine kinase and response regulator CckA
VATILVVDDEQAIRELVGRVLERQGHKVILCQSAVEALAAPAPIDLLLVDLIIPDVNGRQITEQLRARWPSLPVVVMSGYPPDRGTMPSAPAAFLQKPMLPSAVVEAIERLLTARDDLPSLLTS